MKPTRATDYAAWYSRVIQDADLAEHSATRGCMIIKPYGYAIWEKVRDALDRRFKASGHQNVYLPLLIPLSHFAKEAQHIVGFSKECAVVTHHRLQKGKQQGTIVVDPSAKLEEALVVRPTSETVFWDCFRRWIRSYRDLPLLLNQWANVVRWELRTRPFLRTSEILWQEGHTAHATAAEAKEEALRMLRVYQAVLQEHMAIPAIVGEKTPHERFAGAEITYTLEGLMQDGKALQMGTSHFVGQRFAKAFDVQFTDERGKRDYVWGTSWGVTTRLLGALIMVHADDKGLLLPPKIAPVQVIVLPMHDADHATYEAIVAKTQAVVHQLKERHIAAQWDGDMQLRAGRKFHHYECRGVPLRAVIGACDLAQHTIELTRRDTGEKVTLGLDGVADWVEQTLQEMQQSLYEQALHRQQAGVTAVSDFASFQQLMKARKGFARAFWDGTTETEQAIKTATKATIRCLPFAAEARKGRCIYSGKPARQQALFAQAY